MASKLLIAVAALEQIRDFDHAPDCHSSAPLHECCCFKQDEHEIAEKALAEIERAED